MTATNCYICSSREGFPTYACQGGSWRGTLCRKCSREASEHRKSGPNVCDVCRKEFLREAPRVETKWSLGWAA